MWWRKSKIKKGCKKIEEHFFEAKKAIYELNMENQRSEKKSEKRKYKFNVFVSESEFLSKKIFNWFEINWNLRIIWKLVNYDSTCYCSLAILYLTKAYPTNFVSYFSTWAPFLLPCRRQLNLRYLEITFLNYFPKFLVMTRYLLNLAAIFYFFSISKILSNTYSDTKRSFVTGFEFWNNYSFMYVIAYVVSTF